MLNFIWTFFIVFGVCCAFISGKGGEALTTAALKSGQDGIEICLTLIGVMAVWMGLLRIAEKSGLINSLAKIIEPFVRWLFPELPQRHPAFMPILFNISANLLGLGNAATPFGLKAMEELQKLNYKKDTATDSMCTLLVLNTSGLTLIPTTIIALRSATGSQSPTEIVGLTIIATLTATTFGLIIDRLLKFKSR
jgi:spore maturation protein A